MKVHTMESIVGIASCGCFYHAEEGIPCEHDIALAKQRGLLCNEVFEHCWEGGLGFCPTVMEGAETCEFEPEPKQSCWRPSKVR